MHEYNYSKLLGLMAEKGVTQYELAEKISMTPNTLCRKLKSEYDFRQDEITRICEALKIPNKQIPVYFFTHAL